jgi:pimeloyl-ACP methyl ester carboxylesterase
VGALDAAGVQRALAVGVSCGERYALALAAAHPDRVSGVAKDTSPETLLLSECAGATEEVMSVGFLLKSG